jgi:hypothetical protein
MPRTLCTLFFCIVLAYLQVALGHLRCTNTTGAVACPIGLTASATLSIADAPTADGLIAVQSELQLLIAPTTIAAVQSNPHIYDATLGASLLLLQFVRLLFAASTCSLEVLCRVRTG